MRNDTRRNLGTSVMKEEKLQIQYFPKVFLQKDQQQGQNLARLTKRDRERKLKLLLTQLMTLLLLLYQNLTKKKKKARNLHINIYYE